MPDHRGPESGQQSLRAPAGHSSGPDICLKGSGGPPSSTSSCPAPHHQAELFESHLIQTKAPNSEECALVQSRPRGPADVPQSPSQGQNQGVSQQYIWELSCHNEFCFNGASVQSISARIISAWCISAVSLHGVSLQVRPRAWGGAEVRAQAATGVFAFKGQVTKLVCFSSRALTSGPGARLRLRLICSDIRYRTQAASSRSWEKVGPGRKEVQKSSQNLLEISRPLPHTTGLPSPPAPSSLTEK